MSNKSPVGWSARSWWPIAVAALRAVVTASVLTALYFLLPLDRLSESTAVAVLAVGLVAILGLMVWQVRAIIRSGHPGLRGLESLFVSVPLFILVFAALYFLMSQDDPSTFTSELSRTDALYFTVTTFVTVGYGDLTALAQSARLIVTAQMMLDLILLGIGVRVILDAVQRGRERVAQQTTTDPDRDQRRSS
jgi:voltage-gated potassium channel